MVSRVSSLVTKLTKMTKRNVKGRGVGFYVMIEEDEEVEERCLEVKEGDLGDDVYKVERVVEWRTNKVSGCLKPLVYKNLVVI